MRLLFGIGLVILILLDINFTYFPMPYVRLDVLWILVLFWGLHVPYFPGILYILAAAFLKETLYIPMHGPILLSYLLIFFFLRAAKHQLFYQKNHSLVIWLLILTFFTRSFENLIYHWMGYSILYQPFSYALSGLLNGLVALYIFPLLEKIWQGDREDYGY